MLNQFLKLLNLEELRYKKAANLSGGEKQRVSLACALAKEPKLLLLDEPFSHLDVHLRKRVGRFLKKWVKDFEASVLFVTHEGEEALSWSDRILFLKNQRIIRNYSPETAYNSPKTFFEGAFFGELNSVRINGKQVLFRPTQFQLTGDTDSKIKLKWSSSEFRGAYYAHYFSIQNAKTVVLYGTKEVSLLKEVYV
jgi:iron(III) transport system ATP-binding protein